MALSPGTAPFPTRLRNPTDIVLRKVATWQRRAMGTCLLPSYCARCGMYIALPQEGIANGPCTIRNLQGTIRKCPSLQYLKIWVRVQP